MPETSVLAEYLWVFLILIFLEGVLAADNACVMAVIVRVLPEAQRGRALFWGLAGAFVLRFSALFLISYLIDRWEIQAIGALYLLFLSLKHLYGRLEATTGTPGAESAPAGRVPASAREFWLTVLKVEIADIAFAVDSIMAALALALTLRPLELGALVSRHIGGLETAKFLVVFAGGFAGVILMRFAAQKVVELLDRRPALETAAYGLVGWVGVKLMVYTMAHPAVAMLNHGFVESTEWKATFWSVFLVICIGGWFYSGHDDSHHHHYS